MAKERYPEVGRPQQVHGGGPVTSAAFVLTIDDPTRFDDSRRVGSWIGLCPRRDASGDSNPELGIHKSGDCHLRRLLVQCAQYVLGPCGKGSELRRFGLRLVAQRGRTAKRKALTAVAREAGRVTASHLATRPGLRPFHNTTRQAAMAV